MTTTAQRTDIHSPVNMDPTQYNYLFAIDTQTPWALPLMQTPEGRDFQRSLMNFPPETRDRNVHQCHHCGAHIRYAAFLRHLPTGYTIVVGETCLDNRFSLESKAQFDALRKAAALDRAKQRIVTACNEWIATNNSEGIDLSKGAQAPEHANEWEKGTYADIVRKFWTYGNLYPRQYALLVKIATKPAPAPVVETTPTIPAPRGRATIIGDVVFTKWFDGAYGQTLKALVVLDGGAKVWGTLPRGASKGERISFTATFEASRKDPQDAFFSVYKRPSAAVVLGEAQAPAQDGEDSLS